jgi:hypothetical protein
VFHQVRSSLCRPHPSLRVGSWADLGGIWEISYSRFLSWPSGSGGSFLVPGGVIRSA